MLRLICKKTKLLYLYSFKLVLTIGHLGPISVDDLPFPLWTLKNSFPSPSVPGTTDPQTFHLASDRACCLLFPTQNTTHQVPNQSKVNWTEKLSRLLQNHIKSSIWFEISKSTFICILCFIKSVKWYKIWQTQISS